ncbi:nuclear intron maturase 1 -related [Anaeramoeba flamelloides]|uniref:Nuclear intron maturase 1 -related n=1 Tax=Anaeramoeba flamelloides TaxID=1746091 RepID=A0AAV7ZGJ6_9EUKA|nr:nuclear intron maturase 1 -related [Anaeramoeba flamelloides]
MEKEYQEHINSIKKKINSEFLIEIENSENLYKTEKPEKITFKLEEIEEQIKWTKNKSVKEFDKIYLYKKDPRKNEDVNYQKTNRHKETWAVTIDLAKCFDSVPQKLIVKTIPKFIKDPIIKIFITKYYDGGGTGVYQGDPLSQILFAFISHFLLKKIRPHTIHTQMYADDLILIMKGKGIDEIKEKLESQIYPVITKFGLTVNAKKTEITNKLKTIKYLGIWLNKLIHIKKNLEKADGNFNKYIYIYANEKLSNAVRIQLFKAVILPQVLYGLDVFNLLDSDIKKINIWINKKLKKILKLLVGTPTDIIKWETRTEPTSHMILKRKGNFIKKLKSLKLNHLANDLTLPQIKGIDWENMNKKDLKKKIHSNPHKKNPKQNFIFARR